MSNFLIYVWSYCKVKVIDVQCTVMYELSMIVLFNEIIQNINESSSGSIPIPGGGATPRGAPNCYLAKFYRELHEYEDNCIQR